MESERRAALERVLAQREASLAGALKALVSSGNISDGLMIVSRLQSEIAALQAALEFEFEEEE